MKAAKRQDLGRDSSGNKRRWRLRTVEWAPSAWHSQQDGALPIVPLLQHLSTTALYQGEDLLCTYR